MILANAKAAVVRNVIPVAVLLWIVSSLTNAYAAAENVQVGAVGVVELK